MSIKSFAQTPCFTADYTTICVGQTVTFTQCSGWTNVTYDFGDGLGRRTSSSETSVTYTEPGIKEVFQYGNNLIPNSDVNGPLRILVTPLSPPTFTLNSCINQTVEVTLTDDLYENYLLEWDEGPTIPLVKDQMVLLPYSTSGLKTVKIIGSGPALCQMETSHTFEVFSSVPAPVITGLATGENELNISLDPTSLRSYLNYNIYVSEEGGAYVNESVLEKNNGEYSSEYTIQSVPGLGRVNPFEKKYCVRIEAKDGCGNGVSDEACSILLNAESVPDQNNVSWSALQTFSALTLNESAASIPLPSNSSNYVNNNITCNKQYCYSITAQRGALTVTSNAVCVKGRSDKTPPPVAGLNTEVLQGNVRLSWIRPANSPILEWVVTKKTGAITTELYRGQELSIIDELAIAGEMQACYSIFYVDSCGNTSPETGEACPIILQAKQLQKDNNQLEWTEYNGYRNDVAQYIVQYLDERGEVYEERSAGNALAYSDVEKNEEQILRYRIKAVSDEAEPQFSFSNIAEIKQNFLIVLPNAFSPNGDGQNELFHPVGMFIKSYTMQIYNRWGELIFEGQRWDGRGKNGNAPSGSYIYHIEATDFSNQKVVKKGGLVLIR